MCHSNFFPVANTNRHKSDSSETEAVFSQIFGDTVALVRTHTQAMIESSFDAVGLLLCIGVNNLNLLKMQKRRIPRFDNYLNGLNMMLWPRFQAIIDLHIESLKKVDASRLMASIKDSGHPIFITRRYAEFAASILFLSTHGFNEALLVTSLNRLRAELEALLFRLSGELATRKLRTIFFINNYDLVTSILSVFYLISFIFWLPC